MSYDDIRAALQPGSFNVDNLWRVTRLSFDFLYSGEAAHPAVSFAIATTVEKIAARWDGRGLPVDTAETVDAQHVRPKLVALLDAAESDPESIATALDDLARAYADVTPIIDDVV